MSTDVVDQVYLPFRAEQLLQHLAPAGRALDNHDAGRQLQYYLRSAERYHSLMASDLDPRGLAIGDLREPCQLEKDERFWIATCLMGYFHAPNSTQHLATLLCSCFGATPPVEGLPSWEACLSGELHLYFETSLPSPKGYKQWLTRNLREQLFIPYVLNAACRRGTDVPRAELEGATRVDAMLLNAANGFSVLFEAKVLSDISVHVTYDARRNQLARLVDVGLEENKDLPTPWSFRRPEYTLFAMVTPEMFRNNPSSRLYGWLLREYQQDATALARDLPHRGFVNWEAIARRIGWLTWEDCATILPRSCPWLEMEPAGESAQ